MRVKNGRSKGNLKRKKRNSHQILNSQGKKLDNRDEILKYYAGYYKEPLQIRPAESMDVEEIEQIVDKKFQEIIAEGKINREIITKTEIRKAIKGMKYPPTTEISSIFSHIIYFSCCCTTHCGSKY